MTRQTGIIPALAGNTSSAARNSARARDHPRACGEHMMQWYGTRAYGGSSPRLRGTPSSNKHAIAICGIIPALAGNTRP